MLILTFIGSGFSLMGMAMWALMGPTMQEMIATGQAPMPAEFKGMMDIVTNIPRYFFIIETLLYALSLTGAIMMWRYKMIGFHLYSVAQLLLIAVPPLLMGKMFFNLGEAMLTLCFIVFYFTALRQILRQQNDMQMEEVKKEETTYETDDDDDDDDDE